MENAKSNRLAASRGAEGARRSSRKKLVSDAALLADLSRVAGELGRRTLSQTEYTDRGRYSFTTVCRRFSSWKNALSLLQLEPAHLMNITCDELVADLKRVASELNTSHLRFSQYIAAGNYSRKIINRLFGRWHKAAEAAGLTPVIRRPASREELFENLKEMWATLGRRPKYEDFSLRISKFGAAAYSLRFGTFAKAMAAFLEWMGRARHRQGGDADVVNKCSEEDRSRGFVHRTPRTINVRLRFLIMRRDCFRCCACGRSPATDPSVVLQVDHKKAWAAGGETVEKNLQTLCRECNRGKGDLAWMAT